MISRGNPLFFRTFPRLINTILPITILREMAFLPHFAQNSDSLFCAKRYFLVSLQQNNDIHYGTRDYRKRA